MEEEPTSVFIMVPVSTGHKHWREVQTKAREHLPDSRLPVIRLVML